MDPCWICLDDLDSDGRPCEPTCKCKQMAHKSCIVQWQFHNLTKEGELNCQFCGYTYDKWYHYFGVRDDDVGELQIDINDEVHSFIASFDDREAFEQQVKAAMKCKDPRYTYSCMNPWSDKSKDRIVLKGDQAYNNALAGSILGIYSINVGHVDKIRDHYHYLKGLLHRSDLPTNMVKAAWAEEMDQFSVYVKNKREKDRNVITDLDRRRPISSKDKDKVSDKDEVRRNWSFRHFCGL